MRCRMQPEFVMHTGDLTHSSKPAEFDTLEQVLRETKAGQIFYVPGEHDTSVDDGESVSGPLRQGNERKGWYSFDQKGVHFVGAGECRRSSKAWANWERNNCSG